MKSHHYAPLPLVCVEYDDDDECIENTTTGSAEDEIYMTHDANANANANSDDITVNESDCLAVTVTQQQETISALYSENLLLQSHVHALEADLSAMRAKLEHQHQITNQLQAAVLMHQDTVPTCTTTSSSYSTTTHHHDPAKKGGEDDAIMLASVEAGDLELFCTIIRSSSSPTINGETEKDVINRIGEVALLLACENRHFKIAEFLLGKGVSAHVDRDSPLQWAAHNGDIELARLLLRHGADSTVFNNCPLRIALNMGHVDMVHLLTEEKLK
jgi:hypothetical protein